MNERELLEMYLERAENNDTPLNQKVQLLVECFKVLINSVPPSQVAREELERIGQEQALAALERIGQEQALAAHNQLTRQTSDIVREDREAEDKRNQTRKHS